MTDCIRFSIAELEGKESWHVSGDKWTPIISLQGKGEDMCRGACVSEPSCKVWKYNHNGGVCSLSTHEVEDFATTKDEHTSGRIVCAADYNLLKIIGLLVAILIALGLFWYLTKPCKSKK